MKKYLSFLISGLLVLLLFACSIKKEYESTKVRTRKGRATNELVVSMGSRISEFDPKDGFGTHNETHILYSSLLKRTADLEIVGDLAKDYTISNDGLMWTFDLHDNFKFSNGEMVTAEDVKFTFEMLKNDGRNWDLSFIDKIDAPSKTKVIFTLKEPRSTFAQSQLIEVGILPKAHYNDNFKKNPIGSGPYRLVEYKPNEQAIFEVNPYWHGEEPYFKKWTWVLLDENTALAALESEDVDIIYATPEFADKKINGVSLFDIPSNDVRGLSLPYVKKGVVESSPKGYPVGNDVTSDPAIRNALNVGLDRQKVIDTVLNGHGKPAYSIVDEMPFWNPDSIIKTNDIEMAKKILDDAGWKVGADGIREKDGLKAEFELYYATKDQLRTNVSVEAANQAKDLGINIKLVGSDWEEIITKIHEISVLYGGGRLNPVPLYDSYHPNLIHKLWGNVTFYNNTKVTEYLDKAIKSPSLEEANKYWKLAQWDGETGLSIRGDLPNVWLVRINHTYLGDSRINVGKQSIHSHGHAWGLIANIDEWTWEENIK
ncbi:ABC transporter substrate-binding protein [Streptobacillus moniliformis]|uniref:ABC transporter substrate-binding protein n=1 Tax=Streptobacillus moniliformis TaxID=34105 RepID=UPI0007E32ED9|nr:ABC transporter substrate-binding protein [Streptobacillus moniliformis]